MLEFLLYSNQWCWTSNTSNQGWPLGRAFCSEAKADQLRNGEGKRHGTAPVYRILYRDHPVVAKALEAVRELIWDLGDSVIYQPCVSPNWDTALAAKALLEAGLPGNHPALRGAAKWLIDHQIFKKGRLVDQTPGARTRWMGVRVLQRLVP